MPEAGRVESGPVGDTAHGEDHLGGNKRHLAFEIGLALDDLFRALEQFEESLGMQIEAWIASYVASRDAGSQSFLCRSLLAFAV